MDYKELQQNIRLFATAHRIDQNKVVVLGKKDLIAGEYYEGECRNAGRARWDGQKFLYARTKFGSTYLEAIKHFEDDDDGHTDVFVPMTWKRSVFLAGTIDDGHSTDWQKEIVDTFKTDPSVVVYNPRRYDFPEHPADEDIINQIRWEQDHLDKADNIVMVFKDGSKSPITLLELGLYARTHKLRVFCTKKYWRWHNVYETCRKYEIPLFETTNTQSVIDCIKNLQKRAI